MDEQRKHKRINVSMRISFRGMQDRQQMGVVTNISRSGMYVQTGLPVAVGSEFSASLDAPEIGKVISLTGWVRREARNGMAIEFEQIDHAVMATLLP